MNQIRSYKDLDVWKRSMKFVVDLYKITENFPKSEMYGLTSQIRRSAVSIPSNIAEGSRRSRKQYAHFVGIAFASGAELETQLELSNRLNLLMQEDFSKLNEDLEIIMKMLNRLKISLSSLK